jgi:transposase
LESTRAQQRFTFIVCAIIALESEDASPLFGEIEVDESYFGGHRKGKRGRGAGGKIPVFGLLKSAGKVYAKIIPDAKGKTLKAIIEDKVVPDSVVYSDTFSSYNVLDVSRFKHYRINHSELFSDHKNHINGIENFWIRPSGICAVSTASRLPTSTSP